MNDINIVFFFVEILEEQEKEIEQFLYYGLNKNKLYRGRGRGSFLNMRG